MSKQINFHLPENEERILREMASDYDMSISAIIRSALRMKQHLDSRLRKGHKIRWEVDGKVEEEMLIVGCGWPGID